ncbi:4Fe-4S binding protein [Bacteroidales bacterium OttesenSCG-928-K03]|nr:4Fe-4S binding protein [Bacteroidales bacterium OttesenSCG-928-L14]MDL2243044.1 4Fe-4S binding protein [Bacteroidales bacterium OttesenSCG-928-K03]
MLRKIRRIVAIICFSLITLLFLDFTGTLHAWFGWLAKIQLVPAILAVNVGIIIFLLLFTLLFGRVYCSVICPMGVFQDIISRVTNRKKYRFKYLRSLKWLRYSVLVIFCVALIAGITMVFSILEPYSAYGRIASNLFAPIYVGINNFFAFIAERIDSYAFYSVEVKIKSVVTLIVAASTFVIFGVLAWRNGRIYCNTICPVGTFLGLISRFSFFKPRFNESNCTNCGLCEKACKASCINSKERKIDYSRCVACMNCIDNCKQKSITYSLKVKTEKVASEKQTDGSRRNFLFWTAAFAATSAIKAQSTKVDGGLAILEDKKVPNRQTQLTPPGSKGIDRFSKHCISCQLCVTACPNNVLHPSSDLSSFMQPEMRFESGYCRPECTKCSEVCPTGAIKRIDTTEKSSTQIGHAVYIRRNCVVRQDGVSCGNCARHCPTGAIHMIKNGNSANALEFPVVDKEICIGCGSCEYHCPARPFSAIYVEGHEVHRMI